METNSKTGLRASGLPDILAKYCRFALYFAGDGGISILTGSVPQLDILFRFAHKISQSGFDSSRRVSHTLFISSKKASLFYAGDGGIEPPTVLLESAVIPLN